MRLLVPPFADPPQARAPHVTGVSWPRSGHHLLVRLLRLYFGETFTYCPYYGQGPRCCGEAPCRRQTHIRFTKNHDFRLDLPQRRGARYLIQIRAFTPSVVSNFELYVRQGGEDSQTSFARFASAEFTRYRGFCEKWVNTPFRRRQILIDYADLLRDPEVQLARAVRLFAPQQIPDPARLRKAVTQVDGEEVAQGRVRPRPKAGVHPPRDVTQFRHYDARLFGYLDKLRLTRQEVNTLFRAYLGRDAAEENMLAWQTSPSLDALEQTLLASPEYATRRARAV